MPNKFTGIGDITESPLLSDIKLKCAAEAAKQAEARVEKYKALAGDLRDALERLLAFSQHGFSPVEKKEAEDMAENALRIRF